MPAETRRTRRTTDRARKACICARSRGRADYVFVHVSNEDPSPSTKQLLHLSAAAKATCLGRSGAVTSCETSPLRVAPDCSLNTAEYFFAGCKPVRQSVWSFASVPKLVTATCSPSSDSVEIVTALRYDRLFGL